MTKLLEPRVISRRSPDGNSVAIYSAIHCWNIKTLDRITAEFGCDRSNEKAVTLQRGFEKTGLIEVAKRLAGKRFILDTQGRELPLVLGAFSKETLDLVDGFIPDAQNEPFIPDLIGEAREATKFKLLLKSILLYTRLLYTNERDNDLITFEVITEPKGEGTITAAFRGGSEDKDIWCSLAEVSNFRMGS